ncbi:MAG: hypothetical protein JSW13_01440 [Candidatus Aerophobus sp.]|nr:MAG: hypothetical protein JSW13_01440 [Candidatus Aerophobus sp.]
MKRIDFVFVIILLVFLLPALVFSGGVTNLSKKAANLELGMSRKTVINLLGRATWAVIPSDKGEFALPDPRIRLELYWKNPGCAPVIVQFNKNLKVIGWDEGRAYCGKDAHLFEPSGRYSCSKSDRAKYCK